MCERLKDPAVRARIRDEYVETGRNWDRIVIARARRRPEYSGRTVVDLAREAGKDPMEWTCDALIEHDGDVQIVHHSMNEDDVRYVMAKPYIAIGSDSSANAPYGPLSFGKPHPAFLRHVPARAGALRARREGRDARGRGAQDDVAHREASAPRGSR